MSGSCPGITRLRPGLHRTIEDWAADDAGVVSRLDGEIYTATAVYGHGSVGASTDYNLSQ